MDPALNRELLYENSLLENRRYSILLVEDNKGDVIIINELLKSAGIEFTLKHVSTLKETLAVCLENEYDVILLDLGLPDSIGLETLKKIQVFNFKSPVVIMTGLDDESIALEALREGAQDYLAKSRLNTDNILRGIKYAIERKKIQEQMKKNARQFSLLSSTISAINECKTISDIFTEACRSITMLLEKTGVIGIEAVESDVIHLFGAECIEIWAEKIKVATGIDLNERKSLSEDLNNDIIARFNDGKLHKLFDGKQTHVNQNFRKTAKVNLESGGIFKIYAIVFINERMNCGGVLIISRDEILADDGDIIEAIGKQVSLSILRKTIENDLKSSESRYRKLNMELETKVRERTRDLESSNYQLNEELIERHQIEESLKKSEARQKELNATKDKFFNIIAHDLKNPFTCLIGTTELLNSDIDRLEKEKVKELARILNDSAKGGFEILRNLLDWSRSQTGLITYNPEKLLLRRLIEANLSDLRLNSEKKDIRMINKVKTDMHIFADKNMINAVLRNLIGNAIKFTYNMGTVEIEASLGKTDVMISIKDSGIGIPEQEIGGLFRFESIYTKAGTNKEHGTGLGLKICKEFVEMHGGVISVKSTLNKGSEFIFTIPCR